ncbi:MAG TPA: polysaccharide biosynthesis C-terminal domain-containing protein, partial [Ferruginibacter sp.]|nr:polysaccharide biosynthesis C-terminal domain-containing protein [Ferruginibacter sp.]
TRWRFDFFTGIILLTLTLPLNYIFTKYYFGVLGPAIANLISFTIYNTIRYLFLIKKFNLQPFTLKTVYTLLLGVSAFYISYFAFINLHGFAGMICRSCLFMLLYISGTFLFKLSPDIVPVWQVVQKRLGIKKGD